MCLTKIIPGSQLELILLEILLYLLTQEVNRIRTNSLVPADSEIAWDILNPVLNLFVGLVPDLILCELAPVFQINPEYNMLTRSVYPYE